MNKNRGLRNNGGWTVCLCLDLNLEVVVDIEESPGAALVPQHVEHDTRLLHQLFKGRCGRFTQGHCGGLSVAKRSG